MDTLDDLNLQDDFQDKESVVEDSILHQQTYHNLLVLKHRFVHTDIDMSSLMREYREKKIAGTVKICEILNREEKIQANGAPFSVYKPDLHKFV